MTDDDDDAIRVVVLRRHRLRGRLCRVGDTLTIDRPDRVRAAAHLVGLKIAKPANSRTATDTALYLLMRKLPAEAA